MNGRTFGRRGFLLGSGATLLAAACSSGDDGGAATATSSSPDQHHAAHRPAERRPLPARRGLGGPGRRLGDPLDPAGAAAAGRGRRRRACPATRSTCAGRWPPTTASPRSSARAWPRPTPDQGHSLHVAADGPRPGDRVPLPLPGRATSPARSVAPGPCPGDGEAVDRFRLGVANCQWYEAGTYAAYRHMAEDDLDLVVHLGDYIYEYAAGTGRRTSSPNREVDDARATTGCATPPTRSTPTSRPPTPRSPFVATWDDHEVANNYLGDTVPGGRAVNSRLPERRAAAYKAWWENLPTRLPEPDSDHSDIYRDVVVGDLARITLLDERQYADVPPCRDVVDDDFGDCRERDRGPDPPRRRPGGLPGLVHGPGRHDLEPGRQPGRAGRHRRRSHRVRVLPRHLGRLPGRPAPGDRGPGHRPRTPSSSPATTTPGMVLDVNDRPFDADAELVCAEFMAPPISSVLFPDDVSGPDPAAAPAAQRPRLPGRHRRARRRHRRVQDPARRAGPPAAASAPRPPGRCGPATPGPARSTPSGSAPARCSGPCRPGSGSSATAPARRRGSHRPSGCPARGPAPGGRSPGRAGPRASSTGRR